MRFSTDTMAPAGRESDGPACGRIPALICLVTITTLVPACAWRNVQESPDQRTADAVEYAMSVIGAPYRYGGRTPSGFDCSGLVFYAYGNAGFSVPRTSAAQMRAASAVEYDQARRGDLLFFGRGGRVSHVAIYLGDGRFVHAPQTGREVSVGYMRDEWYRQNFYRAGRLD